MNASSTEKLSWSTYSVQHIYQTASDHQIIQNIKSVNLSEVDGKTYNHKYEKIAQKKRKTF